MTTTHPRTIAALSREREDRIVADVTAYQGSHSHPAAFACCSAHAVADAAPELLAEIDRLRTRLGQLETASRPDGRLPRVDHARIAAELRETPGSWQMAASYGSFGTVRQMATRVRHGRMPAYADGQFEAHACQEDGENRLYITYTGERQEAAS